MRPFRFIAQVPRCRGAERLVELRERLGISAIQVHAGPRSVPFDGIAPVVAALAGR